MAWPMPTLVAAAHAPASAAEMLEIATRMLDAQKAAVDCLKAGDAAGAKGRLDELFALVASQQMPLYKRRVEALHAHGGRELYVTLPAVIANLLPKFEQIYRATGNGLVRNETGYSGATTLEEESHSTAALAPAPPSTSRSSSV